MIKNLFSKTRHVIWDWNGTLLNDPGCCAQILSLMLAKRGLPQISMEKYRRIFDFPLHEFYSKVGIDFNKESMDDIAHEFIHLYEEAKSNCQLHPFSVQILKKISAMGIRQSICSASHHDLLEKALRHFGIHQHFGSIHGVDNIKAHGKVNLLIEAMKPHPFAAQETLMIGDTLNDHEIASELGLSILLVAHGHHERSRLEKVHHLVLDDFKPLLDI